MIDPTVGALAAGSLALLFASASWHKWRALRDFESVLLAYRLVPAPAAPVLMVVVPALELGIAAGLLVGALRHGATFAGIALLLAYAIAIGINLGRDRRDLDCGCGARRDRRPIAPWMVVRNVLLALGLSLVLVPADPRPFEATDVLTVGGGIAILALVYVALDQLLGEIRPRAAQLRRPA